MAGAMNKTGPELRIVQWRFAEHWPAGLAVTHQGRNAHVVAIAPGIIGDKNIVPIMYDKDDCTFTEVPSEELKNRY